MNRKMTVLALCVGISLVLGCGSTTEEPTSKVEMPAGSGAGGTPSEPPPASTPDSGSLAPQGSTVPPVVGQQREAAERTIRAAGLRVGSLSFRDSNRSDQDNIVQEQAPTAGVVVPADSTVDITVAQLKPFGCDGVRGSGQLQRNAHDSALPQAAGQHRRAIGARRRGRRLHPQSLPEKPQGRTG